MLKLPILTKSLRIRSLRNLIQPKSFNFRQQFNLNCCTFSSAPHIYETKFKQGDDIHGFHVEDVTTIDEMSIQSIKLIHKNTNAQYLHLSRDDSNNVFSIAFRTTPMNSSGVPHILEHLVTCGGEKFSCRDVFLKMHGRSLATFMNALTGPDYTFYPFSSQNEKDFRNLQSVYLDFVLKPKLREIDFWQEGWRLEHSDPNDKSSRIIFKGVVFNEMKGVFNENQYLLMYSLMNNLLPSHTYGHISGGNPINIIELTYKELVEFHRKYYHPSNGRFFSYGNLPLENHLKFLNDEYLSSINKISVEETRVPLEPRWTSPRKKHITCRSDPLIADPKKQSTIVIGHICNPIDDIDTTFSLSILSELLMKGPNSAFYKSLIEKKMGSSFASCSGYSSQLKDTMFAVGLQEVEEEKFDKIEQIYNETLANVVKEGFDKKQIEAILHNIELNNKHQSSNFGLHLLFNLTPLWNHVSDCTKLLKINEMIKHFRNNLESDPKFLEKLVEKYLINNNHKLVVTMSPDVNYESDLAAKEKQLLNTKIAQLSKEEADEVYNRGQSLLLHQKSDNVGNLPMLHLNDLKPEVDRYLIENVELNNVVVQISVQPTNEVCYYHSILNTSNLSDELISYLPLFNEILTEMGTKNYDYRQFDELVHLKTGGLGINNHVVQQKNDLFTYEKGIKLNSYCLNYNVENMWNLWEEIFNRVKLTDLQRFETLVKMSAANLLNGIAYSGHSYAMSSAASIVSPISKLKESLGGLEYINRIKNILNLKDFSPLLDKMNVIAESILNKKYMRSFVNFSDNKDKVLDLLNNHYSSLNGSTEACKVISKIESFEPSQKSIHHVLPYDVNYSSKAILTVPYVHPDYPILRILAKILTYKYLLSEIREKGCAYGAGAKINSDGVFTFYSYRDPNSTQTFDIYDKAYDFLSNYDLSEQNLTEAKIAVFQEIDEPVQPSSRGLSRFIHGVTYDDIQETRLRVKNANADQLRTVADKYLKPNTNTIVGRALIGPSNPDLIKRQSEQWEIYEQETNVDCRLKKSKL